MNFWILGILISIAVVVFCGVLVTNNVVNDDFAGIIVIIGMLSFVVFLFSEIVVLVNSRDCHIDYNNDAQYRADIILKSEIISSENSEAVKSWYDEATKFNRKLLTEQDTINYWGNWFCYHDERYLELEPIDVKNYVTNISTQKSILEKN